MHTTMSFLTSTSATASELPAQPPATRLELVGYDRAAGQIVLREHVGGEVTTALLTTTGVKAGTIVPLARGTRIQGKSKMGFLGLFTHGIRMLMPFSERIAIRGMIFSTFLFAVSAVFLVWTLLCEGKIIFPVALMGLSFWTGGVSVLLFATFSQSKSRSLRAMQDVPRSGSKA